MFLWTSPPPACPHRLQVEVGCRRVSHDLLTTVKHFDDIFMIQSQECFGEPYDCFPNCFQFSSTYSISFCMFHKLPEKLGPQVANRKKSLSIGRW